MASYKKINIAGEKILFYQIRILAEDWNFGCVVFYF